MPSCTVPTRLSMSDTSIVVMKRRSVSLATLAAMARTPNTLISRLTQYLHARFSGARFVLSKILKASSKYCGEAPVLSSWLAAYRCSHYAWHGGSGGTA